MSRRILYNAIPFSDIWSLFLKSSVPYWYFFLVENKLLSQEGLVGSTFLSRHVRA